jgi:hypothetical protein
LDGAAGVGHVMQRKAGESEVECVRLERKPKCVSDLKPRVRNTNLTCDRTCLVNHGRREIHPDVLADVRRKFSREQAWAAGHIEGAFVAARIYGTEEAAYCLRFVHVGRRDKSIYLRGELGDCIRIGSSSGGVPAVRTHC